MCVGVRGGYVKFLWYILVVFCVECRGLGVELGGFDLLCIVYGVGVLGCLVSVFLVRGSVVSLGEGRGCEGCGWGYGL